MDQQTKLMMINEMIEDLQSLSKYYIQQVNTCRDFMNQLINIANSRELEFIDDMNEKEFREWLFNKLDGD